MATPDDVRVLVASNLTRRGVRAAFLERTGGISAPPFDTLNLGFGTGDDLEAVRVNRRRASGALDVSAFATARQVHGSDVAEVDRARAGAGFDDPSSALPPADILTTRVPGVALGTLVADCLPVVLGAAGRLASVHAGWRGVAGGVLPRAVSLFDAPRSVAAWIGPGIGPCHYEVGPEVIAAVEASTGAAVQRRRNGRTFLDLRATAAGQLRGLGVADIEVVDECTACSPDRFFSHRRDGMTGRHASVAVLE
ncbi:MAG TPA: peptidoglycan editing factor PgeF [Actinomycetota bacterium]|nr:peptidoglycan editing factor PgeF [Actinomycetota bacterium]